jgi:predicted amidohydrolase YtcJ
VRIGLRFFRSVARVLLVFLAVGLGASSVHAQGSANERLFFNAKIFTAEPEHPYAEAIAIRGGKIVAVGAFPEVAKSVSANAERVDLQGNTLFPGFIDSHMHAMSGGMNLISADASDKVETMGSLVLFCAAGQGIRRRNGRWNFGNPGAAAGILVSRR